MLRSDEKAPNVSDKTDRTDVHGYNECILTVPSPPGYCFPYIVTIDTGPFPQRACYIRVTFSFDLLIHSPLDKLDIRLR